MAKVKATKPLPNSGKKMRPALTPDVKEQRVFNEALNLVEQRIRDGTASSQETTAVLRLLSRKTTLEMQKLEKENELLRAKTSAIESQKENRADYKKVLMAMGIYSGHNLLEDDDDEFDY